VARRLYLRSIEADPGFAITHHRLAWTHLIDYELGWRDPPEASVADALAAAQRAVELDPIDARSEMALSSALTAAGDFEAADVHARRALKLNSNDAEIVVLRGNLDILLGNPETGLPLVEQAMRQNPFGPDYYQWIYGMGLYTAGRYSEALTAFHEMKDLPTVVRAMIAATLAQLDRMDEAKREMAKFLQIASAEHATYPGFDPLAWRAYFSHSLHYRDPSDLDRWIEGLSKAGLPG
jgi:Flp pilus assembly protein TadD